MIDGGRPSSLHLGVAAVSANVLSRRLPRIVVRGNNIIRMLFSLLRLIPSMIMKEANIP